MGGYVKNDIYFIYWYTSFMAYDLHVIRTKSWLDKEGPVIEEKEWSSLVEADPSLKMVDTISGTTKQGATLTMGTNGKPSAEWVAPSGEKYWIILDKGKLYSSHASDELISKLKEIAVKLEARVQGDEGEFYE